MTQNITAFYRSEVRYEYAATPADRFRFDHETKTIGIGGRTFNFSELHLEPLSDSDRTDAGLTGTIQFHQPVRWPDRWYSPGSMGPYNFVPRMQCHSQVCLVDAHLSGKVTLNGRTIDFDGGRGYVEKNWGRAFPYGWIWVQSSNFTDPSVTVNCSIGHVPMGPGSFRGHLIGVTWQDQFLPFTTMNRSRLRITPRDQDVSIAVENNMFRLWLDTHSREDQFLLCRGPRDGKMIPMVYECLQGMVDLRLEDRRTGRTLVKTRGHATGLEYGGDQMKVIDNLRRMP